MDTHTLASRARRYIENEYHATISDQDAQEVATAASSFVVHREAHPNAVAFVKSTSLAGKPPLEDAFFYLAMEVL